MIVIGEKYGQLGNRLWLFANLVAFSAEYGATVFNPAFDEYSEHFVGCKGNLLSRYPGRSRPWRHSAAIQRAVYPLIHFLTRLISRTPFTIPFIRCLTLWDELDVLDLRDERFLSAARKRGILIIRGWGFRDRRSLEKHQDIVRSFLRVTPEINERVIRTVKAAREGFDILIGVHIRQGDIKFWKGGDFYFETSEYADMMRRLATQFSGKVRFIVCSDQHQNEGSFEGLDVSFGPGDPIGDMHALSLCDRIIGPPSTFTMWASFSGQTPLHVLSHPAHEIGDNRFAVWLDA